MSCLFNSLGRLLNVPTFECRQFICDYLEANRPIIEGIETRDILSMESPNYIVNMRNMSTWGGAIEIQAACNVWSVSVIVENRRDMVSSTIEFVPLHGDITSRLYIYWTGGHYEPLRKV